MPNCYMRVQMYAPVIALRNYIEKTKASRVLNNEPVIVYKSDIDWNAPLWVMKSSPTIIKKGDMTMKMHTKKGSDHNLYYYVRVFYKGLLFVNQSCITTDVKYVPDQLATIIQKFFKGYEADYETIT